MCLLIARLLHSRDSHTAAAAVKAPAVVAALEVAVARLYPAF